MHAGDRLGPYWPFYQVGHGEKNAIRKSPADFSLSELAEYEGVSDVWTAHPATVCSALPSSFGAASRLPPARYLIKKIARNVLWGNRKTGSLGRVIVNHTDQEVVVVVRRVFHTDGEVGLNGWCEGRTIKGTEGGVRMKDKNASK